jgi:hypothetical protein
VIAPKYSNMCVYIRLRSACLYLNVLFAVFPYHDTSKKKKMLKLRFFFHYKNL